MRSTAPATAPARAGIPCLIALALVTGIRGPDALGAQEVWAGAEIDRGTVVTGQLVDRISGAALPSAGVVVDGDVTWEGATDDSGRFRSDALPLGIYELRVEAFGYDPLSRDLSFAEGSVTDLRIEMVPVAFDLDPVIVTTRRLHRLVARGFYERRQMGLGYTMTREEIEALGSGRISDIFHAVPGADVFPARVGRAPAGVRLRGECVPQVVLDGSPFSFPVSLDEVLTVDELEALEVYHGTVAPVQYPGDSCGTIMLWTRRGQSQDESDPFSWRRFVAAVGIVGLVTFFAR